MKLPTRKKSIGNSIVFDIETIAQNEEKLLALAPNFEPDSRLKDPEKIAANIQKQKENYLERAALNWKTASIALIGLHDGTNYLPLCHESEADNLSAFFAVLDKSINDKFNIGGHNIKGFDLPMIVNRSRALRVKIPDSILTFWNGRPKWNEQIFDTLEIFSFGDKSKIEGNGVEDICRALGVKGKTGDGAQFGEIWKSNKQNGIDYNMADCLAEIEIAKTCGYKFNE